METKKLVKESFFREINFISLQTESTRFGQFGYIEKKLLFRPACTDVHFRCKGDNSIVKIHYIHRTYKKVNNKCLLQIF